MTIIRADALDLLQHVPMGTVDCLVTSPPYPWQRVYGNDPREGGREPSIDDYVRWLADVLDQARYTMRPDAPAWVNLGDKANGSGGAGGDWSKGQGIKADAGSGPGKFLDPAYAEQTYLDAPGQVLHELLRRGWRLRAQVIWDKGTQEKISLDHANRPRWQHEVIYLLAPTSEPLRFWPHRLKEKGTVWRFPPGANKRSDPHLAPFPDELARRCISPSTQPGDLVLDCFAGSGTTIRVAELMGRRGIGLDLYAPDPLTSENTDSGPSDEEAKPPLPPLRFPLSPPSMSVEEQEARRHAGTCKKDGTCIDLHAPACCLCSPNWAKPEWGTRRGYANTTGRWLRCPNGCEPRREADGNPYLPTQSGHASALWFEDDPTDPNVLIPHRFEEATHG